MGVEYPVAQRRCNPRGIWEEPVIDDCLTFVTSRLQNLTVVSIHNHRMVWISHGSRCLYSTKPKGNISEGEGPYDRQLPCYTLSKGWGGRTSLQPL